MITLGSSDQVIIVPHGNSFYEHIDDA